jgi:hypothetical protein
MMMFSNIDDEIETEFEMYLKDRTPVNENSIGDTNEIKGFQSTINGVTQTRKTMSKGSDDEGTFQEAV